MDSLAPAPKTPIIPTTLSRLVPGDVTRRQKNEEIFRSGHNCSAGKTPESIPLHVYGLHLTEETPDDTRRVHRSVADCPDICDAMDFRLIRHDLRQARGRRSQ